MFKGIAFLHNLRVSRIDLLNLTACLSIMCSGGDFGSIPENTATG
jgi:hypothetical protein